MRAVALVVFFGLVTPALGTETARQILDRRKALDDGPQRWEDRRQRLRFSIATNRGSKLTREVEVAERRGAGDERQTMVFVLAPADLRGTGLRSITRPGEAAQQSIYLPESRRVRVIVGNLRAGKFLKSDLTYRDLEILAELPSWTERDATSTRLDDERVEGVVCHVIELVPRRTDVGYTRIRLWLGHDDLVPRRFEFIGDTPTPTKRITQRDIRVVDAIPVAYATHVETVGKGTSTEITVIDTKFNLKLGDEGFSLRALEQGPE